MVPESIRRSLEKLIDLLVFSPRKRFGIPLEGDLCVWDLGERYRIDPEDFLSKGRATPFAGREVYGRCLCTVHGGKVVYKKEK